MAAAGRMRRVDEAVRQVLADAIAEELKDPRVGFVTVTDVSTSPDLTSARVYVSVLGEAPDREASLAGLRHAHGYLQGADRPGAEAAPHADARVSLRRHDGPRDAHRAAAARAGRSRMTDAPALALDARAAVLATIKAEQRFLLVTHEHPDGDALGSLIAMQALLRALDKDSVMVIAPDDFPLPNEYRFLSLDGLVTGPPPDLAERTVMFLDCGNLDRNPLAALHDVKDARQHRPSPRQHALRQRQLRRRGSIVHRRDRLGSAARDRRRADDRDRGGALRRARHRHGAVLLREHDAALAPDGGRADQRRRRRRRDVPADLRGDPAGQAGTALPRAPEPARCSPTIAWRPRC